MFDTARWNKIEPNLRSQIEGLCIEVSLKWPASADPDKEKKLTALLDSKESSKIRELLKLLPNDQRPQDGQLLAWIVLLASSIGRTKL